LAITLLKSFSNFKGIHRKKSVKNKKKERGDTSRRITIERKGGKSNEQKNKMRLEKRSNI
jgi:hypothetical protein